MTSTSKELNTMDHAGSSAGLAKGEVSLFGDVVAAITNVAPSTSIALSLGAVMAVSGLASPAVVVTVGLVMLCIAVSYHHLNLWQPSAAAQAMWIARTVRPVVGLAVGFIVLVMTLVSNIGNITLFGPYLLGVVWPSQQDNKVFQWLVTAVAMALVLYVAIEGIKRAIKFQTYIVWVEYAIIIGFVIAMLVAEFKGNPGTTIPQLSWLLPTTAPSLGGFINGVIIGVFMYGGWEASVYLAEEGTDNHRNPGRAGIISVVFCIVGYLILTMVVQGIAPADDLIAHAGNIVAYSAGLVLPQPWASIVSLAVLSSVVAVSQSQLQNFSRMGFGLARDGLLPAWLRKLGKHQTPIYALLFAAAVPVLLLIVYLANTTAATSLALVSGTAGFIYITVYVAGAIACVWYYRRTLLTGPRQFIFAGLLPAIGAGALIFVAIAAIPTTPHGTLYPWIAMVVLAFPAAWVVKRRTKAPFFALPVLAADPKNPIAMKLPAEPVTPPPPYDVKPLTDA
jgi:amino acid transporter